MKVYAVLHKPESFSLRSGMFPLAEAVGASPVYYQATYKQIMRRSWRLGYAAQQAGIRYYGSEWNAILPWWGEQKLAAAIRAPADVVHFLWSEFASPAHPAWFRRKAKTLIGTFHASARKLPMVIRPAYRGLDYFDGITLMSASQKPFFLDRGYPEDRLKVILHGVDSRHFVAPSLREPRAGALRGLMVGSTERDHALMNEVLRKIPKGVLELTILTADEQRKYYYDASVAHASFPGALSDDALLRAYQQADLLVLPLIDCTANNAVMESMACGTPVMVNRVGGISEYVNNSCSVVIDEHTVDAWVDRLVYWKNHRDDLEAMRPAVRAWAEQFDWREIAKVYEGFYREMRRS